jgi:hypothetical protein
MGATMNPIHRRTVETLCGALIVAGPHVLNEGAG